MCHLCKHNFSREKQALQELITDDWIDLIKKHIGLKEKDFKFNSETTSVCLEAQKSLCNIAYNCRLVAEKCCKNGILEGIVERIKKFR